MKTRLPDDVKQALADAGRTPGWNLRSPDVRRFELPGHYGQPCTLIVVPARCWANRRQERAAAAWRRSEVGSKSSS